MARYDFHRPEQWRQLAPLCAYSAHQLAAKAEVSGTHLVRCARELFNCTPQKLLDRWRLLAAPEVLERERSLKVAAFSLGYKQRSHFSRMFKSFYGVAPGKYLALSDIAKRNLLLAVQGAGSSSVLIPCDLEREEIGKLFPTDTKCFSQIHRQD